MSVLVDCRDIMGKSVYIVEDHASAILAWAEVRHKLSNQPWLLSLDYHTDCTPAFVNACCASENSMQNEYEEYQAERLRRINIRDSVCLRRETCDLHNDEQIDAAIRLGLFRGAVVLCGQSDYTTEPEEIKEWRYISTATGMSRPSGPYTYETSLDNMYIIGPNDGVGTADKAYAREHVTDSGFLQSKLTNCVLPALRAMGVDEAMSCDYVFDIDLDAFQTFRSVSPENSDVFHALIRKTVAVTIACERAWVNRLKVDRELTSDFLLDRMIEHIEQAMLGR